MVKYSQNSIGTNLSGSIVGRILRNTNNLITNSSWGLMYEYQLRIQESYFSFGLGVEKQKSNFEDASVTVYGIYSDNYAIHSALGFNYPLFHYIHLYTKLFATNVFHNNNNISNSRNPYTGALQSNNNVDIGSFVPLQSGVELGFKISFFTIQ